MYKISDNQILLVVVITAFVVGGGVYWWQTTSNPSYQKVAMFNCEQSGGTFAADSCQCPTNHAVAQAPAYSYDEQTGYCRDSFSIAGGELGKTAKKLQEFQTLKNQ